jgi:hypothetical protein
MPDSIATVVGDYVFEVVFGGASNKLSKTTQLVLQGYCLVAAWAETSGAGKMRACDRNSHFIDCYTRHAAIVYDRHAWKDNFSATTAWPPPWVVRHGANIFMYSDIKFTNLMATTDKQKDGQWARACGLVKEIRKIAAIYQAAIKNRLPSGTQLIELLEKIRVAVFQGIKVENTLKMDKVVVNDDVDAGEEEDTNAAVEQSNEAALPLPPQGWMSAALFAFFLLGPLSKEPINLGFVGRPSHKAPGKSCRQCNTVTSCADEPSQGQLI